jgi:hypothetical protein
MIYGDDDDTDDEIDRVVTDDDNIPTIQPIVTDDVTVDVTVNLQLMSSF